MGGCEGAEMAEGRCLAHAEERALVEATGRWHDGEPIDAREARIDEAALARLLGAITEAEADSHPQPLRRDRRPSVRCEALFKRARFTGRARFSGVTFEGPALFDGAVFEGDADFEHVEFLDHADFDNGRFLGVANFKKAIFNDHAGFQDVVAADAAVFGSAKFRSYVDFERATFDGDLDLNESSFQFVRRLGRFTVRGLLDLDESEFGERIAIEVGAERIQASAAIFSEGVRLLVEGAALKLDCVDFGRSSTLSALGGTGEGTPTAMPSKPRLLTLHGAQVSSLAVSGIDLRDCVFFGAHGLEQMKVEPSCLWRRTPKRRRLSDREILVEEQRWRAGRGGWLTACFATAWKNEQGMEEAWSEAREEERELGPKDVAALYRALRKAREDSKDQPGAGDLYYGEMEMRLRAPLPRRCLRRPRAFFDRCVIAGYWLLSGYGLRPSRAFGVWLALVGGAALGLQRSGFEDPVSYAEALLFAAESCSSLIREPHQPACLTGVGRTGEFALRLCGPLLIGLFLLALRARVKR